MTLRTTGQIFGLMSLRTINLSDQWPFGLLTIRTNGMIFGPMTLRTTDLSDYWPFGLVHDFRTNEPSDQRPFGISSCPRRNKLRDATTNSSGWRHNFGSHVFTSATMVMVTAVSLIQNGGWQLADERPRYQELPFTIVIVLPLDLRSALTVIPFVANVHDDWICKPMQTVMTNTVMVSWRLGLA